MGYATLTAIAREVTYASLRPVSIGPWKWHCPSLGPVLLALANLTILMVFCFYKLNTADQWSWENIGYRTGFMSISQLPMIILLAGKNNLIGYLTGVSHERLNWFHRWFSRILWLTVTIHMCFWFRSWGRYHFIVAQLKENTYARTGFSSWIVLTFMLLTSSKPIRVHGYEIFLPLHLCTWAGFIAAVYYHAPDEVKAWVWVPIGLFCFDRLSRAAIMVFNNIRFSSCSCRRKDNSPLWANRANFIPLSGGVTKITILNPSFTWKPGCHIFLGCHSLAPFQSHPFTIASIPADGALELFVRAEKGATRRFFKYASEQASLVSDADNSRPAAGKMVTIEGPYGTIRDLRQFDSVVLIAGGIGATYTVPLLRDIIHGWKIACSIAPSGDSTDRNLKTNIVTRNIRFIWIVKSRTQLTWFGKELRTAVYDLERCRAQKPETQVKLGISVYLTCDEALSESPEDETRISSKLGGKYASGASTLSESSEDRLSLSNNKEKTPEQKLTDNDSFSPKSNRLAPKSCGTGACRCKHTIDDETTDEINPCCCSKIPESMTDDASHVASFAADNDKAMFVSGSEDDEGKGPPNYTQEAYPKFSESAVVSSPLPQLRILTGRPDSRNIIRATLERARGESGIVVCGPRGLKDDVQRSVTALSDERAVHKGTGAQGIYFHSEGFWY